MVFYSKTNSTRQAPDFRKFFEAAPMSCLMLSSDFEILAVTDAYLRMARTSRERLVGRRLEDDFSRNSREPWIGGVRRLLISLRRVVRTGRTDRIVLRKKCADRSALPGNLPTQRSWRTTISPVCDVEGNLAYVLLRLDCVREPASKSRQNNKNERRLISTQEEDRKRIARELHDQMAQYLVAMMLGLEALKNQASPHMLDQGIEHMQELIQTVGREVHRLTWDLRPAPIEDLGFRNSLEHCVEELSLRSAARFDFHSNLSPQDRFDPSVETICYRIVQEGLANIVKHAQASAASVIVTRTGNELRIIVEDDGVGFSIESADAAKIDQDHIGLRGMRERLSLIEGSLQMESTIGHGTSLFVHIPLNAEGEVL
jgi:signal transduction histidine kinase